MSEMVLFHKFPAKWNKKEFIEHQLADSNSVQTLLQQAITTGINSMLEEDIYIQLCSELRELHGIGHLHIVQGFIPDEAKNWFVEEQAGRYPVNQFMTYWCITDIRQLKELPKAEFVFSRGNYTQLHWFLRDNEVVHPNVRWIHYPATSVFFPHLESYRSYGDDSKHDGFNKTPRLIQHVLGMGVEHGLELPELTSLAAIQEGFHLLMNHFQKLRDTQVSGPYHAVLVDDESSMDFYQQKYPNCLIMAFRKPSLIKVEELRFERRHDLIFCGTTLQTTKNHNQFLELLDQLDLLASKRLSVAVVGNQGNLPAFSEGLRKQYNHLQVMDFGEVSRQRLADLFNDSRAQIILSGRDSNPRVIQEAGVCGARVLVADTLSDGYDVIKTHPILGKLISTNKESWFYQQSGNLVFDVDQTFAQQILQELEHSKHPFLTSSLAQDLYSFESVMHSISDFLKVQNLD